MSLHVCAAVCVLLSVHSCTFYSSSTCFACLCATFYCSFCASSSSLSLSLLLPPLPLLSFIAYLSPWQNAINLAKRSTSHFTYKQRFFWPEKQYGYSNNLHNNSSNNNYFTYNNCIYNNNNNRNNNYKCNEYFAVLINTKMFFEIKCKPFFHIVRALFNLQNCRGTHNVPPPPLPILPSPLPPQLFLLFGNCWHSVPSNKSNKSKWQRYQNQQQTTIETDTKVPWMEPLPASLLGFLVLFFCKYFAALGRSRLTCLRDYKFIFNAKHANVFFTFPEHP